MSHPEPKPRLAYNLLQLYSLEAWGSDDAPEEITLEEALDGFIAAVIEWDDGVELADYAWMRTQ